MLTDKIQSLLSEVSNLQAADAKALEELRIKYLSKKVSLMNSWANSVRSLPTKNVKSV